MSDHASAHPLDSDLLDFVEGTLPAVEARPIDEHLAGCILCRIKRQRLTNAPPVDLTGVQDLALPTFTPIRTEPLDGSEAVRGDLWTTASVDRAMVLIRSVRENDWGIVGVPVILDVEVADSGALVLDERTSPLDTPIAIYERMTISMPLSALAARIVPARSGIDLWALAAGDPGVTRGSGLQGATDPRVELRQYLADRLVALDPRDAGDGDGADDSSALEQSDDEIFGELVRGFYGKATEAEQISLERAATVPPSWRGIVRVHKFNQAVLLIDTVNGLEDKDRRFAASLCDEFHGSAVAVMAAADRGRTDIYPRSYLVGETNIESGEVVTGPLITGHMVDVIARYLDHLTEVPHVSEQQSETKRLVDPKEILASKVADALSEQVAGGDSAITPSKKKGYQSVADDGDALTEILRTAFSGEVDLQAIRDLAGLEDQE
jgi:hypothetical protein